MKGSPYGIAPASLTLEDGVWLSGTTSPLEGPYHRVREVEGRLLEDAVVRELPSSGNRTAQPGEWLVRRASMERLIRDLRRQGRTLDVLDVGCGNGWLSARLAGEGHRVVGLDVHRAELEQAARVFNNDRLWFVHGDLLHFPILEGPFDRIVFAASVQYFSDLDRVIGRSLPMLAMDGEIHVLDSPLYKSEIERERAAERSRRYFTGIGAEAMIDLYHHHVLPSLQLHGALASIRQPGLLSNLFRRLGRSAPAFPHVIIRKRDRPRG